MSQKNLSVTAAFVLIEWQDLFECFHFSNFKAFVALEILVAFCIKAKNPLQVNLMIKTSAFRSYLSYYDIVKAHGSILKISISPNFMFLS